LAGDEGIHARHDRADDFLECGHDGATHVPQPGHNDPGGSKTAKSEDLFEKHVRGHFSFDRQGDGRRDHDEGRGQLGQKRPEFLPGERPGEGVDNRLACGLIAKLAGEAGLLLKERQPHIHCLTEEPDVPPVVRVNLERHRSSRSRPADQSELLKSSDGVVPPGSGDLGLPTVDGEAPGQTQIETKHRIGGGDLEAVDRHGQALARLRQHAPAQDFSSLRPGHQNFGVLCQFHCLVSGEMDPGLAVGARQDLVPTREDGPLGNGFPHAFLKDLHRAFEGQDLETGGGGGSAAARADDERQRH
jgi:hypothetical protein